MNLPNKITIFRICLIPVFLIVLLGPFFGPNTSRTIATIIFIIASATDALDGHIARSRNLITNFGKFMDPLADKLLVSSALIAMVELNDLSSWVVILIISREFIITAFRTIAADKKIVIAASNWGKVKTTTQMIMIVVILANLKAYFAPFEIIGTILIILSIIFTLISAIDYILKNIDVLKG
ncbi:MAG: CDP-diacylglycerol--glycerol-3-phosphate 3-phosphatidyltransferase [Clostridiales bacterium]|jgi:CDP-diacylglycerol--glycerol-3-phosphate 3-phosphatidyltransferase|nr:CDP-diacylglycerol--glycerol-3-phosphate 3-phosphatidyltransferase [Clostridiales bacterium]